MGLALLTSRKTHLFSSSYNKLIITSAIAKLNFINENEDV